MIQEAGTRGNKNYFVKLVFSDPFQHGFPVSANKDGLLLLLQGGHLSAGKLYGLFLSKKKWSESLPVILCFFKHPWRRERLPTPVFWPGEFHGLYSPWGRKESDMTERLSISISLSLQIIIISK